VWAQEVEVKVVRSRVVHSSHVVLQPSILQQDFIRKGGRVYAKDQLILLSLSKNV
jgi:hypothetical protein